MERIIHSWWILTPAVLLGGIAGFLFGMAKGIPAGLAIGIVWGLFVVRKGWGPRDI